LGVVRFHVVKLFAAVAPDGVEGGEVGAVVPDAEGFVRVIEVQLPRLLPTITVWRKTAIPELDLDVLVLTLGLDGRCGISDRCAVEVCSEWDAEHLQDRGGHVGVVVREGVDEAFRDVGAADEERDVDVFFVGAAFTRFEAVVADVEAVV